MRKSIIIDRFKEAPLELKVFALFCLIISFYGILIHPFLPPKFTELIIPYTGTSLTKGYPVCLVFIFGLFAGYKKGVVNFQIACIAMLVMHVGFGIQDLLIERSGTESNPYLYHHPLRPIWTIIIPGIWAIILMSPRIRRFMNKLYEEQLQGELLM